jgi:predicted ATP-dependent Lon-type protease
MPRFVARTLSIGTVAVPIGTASPGHTHEVSLTNHDNAEIYVGGSAIVAGEGFHIHKGEGAFIAKITDGDILYAIASATNTDLHIYDYTSDL